MAAEKLTLRVPELRVERRAVWLWTLRSLCLAVPVIVGLVVLHSVWDGGRAVTGPAIVVAAVAAAVHTAVVPSWRYAIHRWETTDEAVYARSGWIVHEWRVAPISRIQTVDTSRGPIEQLLGLSTLAVTTASSHGAIYIRGLDRDTAAAAAAGLREITQLTPGDQT